MGDEINNQNGPLSGRKEKDVARVKSKKNQTAIPPIDFASIFQGARSMPIPHGYKRPMVRRGLSGAELNPDGSDPGNSYDKFLQQNPQYNRGNRTQTLQNESNQRWSDIFNQGQQAVDFAKRTGGFTQPNGAYVSPYAPGGLPGVKPQMTANGLSSDNVVWSDGPDGMWKTLFNNAGQAVGTNRPAARPPMVDEGMLPREWQQSDPMRQGNLNNPNLGPEIQQQFEQNPQYATLFGKSASPAPMPTAPLRPSKSVTPPTVSQGTTSTTSPLAPALNALQSSGVTNVIPSLWDSGNAFLYGLGDIYSNYVGRPLDQLLFGLPVPAQPSNNMEQYQKAHGYQPGWF